MQRKTKCSSKSLKNMFQSTFRISTIFGLFPFVFTDNDLILSLPLISYSAVYLTVVSCTVVYISVIQYVSMKTRPYAFIFSMLVPYLLSIVVQNMSLFWLGMNLKNLRKIFRALKVIEGVVQSHRPFSNHNQHFFLFFFLAGMFILEAKLSNERIINIVFVYLKLVNVYLVMIQFISFLTIIRSYYSFLEANLSNSTAMEWAQCHEVLTACCEIVNRCYSPQLFIFSISTFSLITSTIYVLIAHMSFFEYGPRIIAMLWVFFMSLSVWGFIHYCHDTVQKAKNFDKALYRIVLNDNSKSLVRNKRILYHFQAKRKVVFSAMGFFEFDYSLICRMVSTATTYIVIMVQFNP